MLDKIFDLLFKILGILYFLFGVGFFVAIGYELIKAILVE